MTGTKVITFVVYHNIFQLQDVLSRRDKLVYSATFHSPFFFQWFATSELSWGCHKTKANQVFLMYQMMVLIIEKTNLLYKWKPYFYLLSPDKFHIWCIGIFTVCVPTQTGRGPPLAPRTSLSVCMNNCLSPYFQNMALNDSCSRAKETESQLHLFPAVDCCHQTVIN